MKFPKTIGEAVDLLYKVREQRLNIEKQAAAVKEQETALKEHIMNNFDKSSVEGVKGKLATASFIHSTVPSVKDWDALYEYIRKNKAYDLMQRRLSVEACRARWDTKKTIPGVEPIPLVTLSLVKAGTKSKSN